MSCSCCCENAATYLTHFIPGAITSIACARYCANGIFTSSKPLRPLGKHDSREVCCKPVKEYCDADNDTDYTSSIQQTQYLYICDRYSGRVSEKVLVQAQARYQGEEMFAILHFGMGSPIVDTV